MISIIAGGNVVVGVYLGIRLGRHAVIKPLAWGLMLISGAAAFLWQSEPFASIVEMLGIYYAVLSFAAFYTSFGVLLGLLLRSLKTAAPSR
jgi:hypothetical protein